MNRYFLSYLSALLLFGANGVVASHIGLPSTEIVLLRTGIGGGLLAALFFLCGGRLTAHRKPRAALFLTLSGVAMGASWLFLYAAYALIGVGSASLLYYCGPVIVMALSPLLFGERLTVGRMVGFAVVAVGVLLVNGGGETALSPVGLGCGLMSVCLYAVMVICSKKAAAIEGLENAMLQLVVSFLTVALFVVIRGGMAAMPTAADVWPILLLGLGNTGIGCWLYFSSIGHLPMQTVAVCGYLEPLSAVLFAVLLLGEPMGGAAMVGAVMILGGALWSERKRA